MRSIAQVSIWAVEDHWSEHDGKRFMEMEVTICRCPVSKYISGGIVNITH